MTTLLAKALFDNVAETVDELSFRKGDIMVVLEPDTAGLQGWWLCSLHGRQGIVPGNRVRLLEAGVNYQLGARRDQMPQSQPCSPPPPQRPNRENNGHQTPGKESWGVYQVPPRCEAPCRGPLRSMETQEVYQVPLARSCPKPLLQGGSPARTQDNDYLVPDIMRTPRGKTQLPAEEESEVYVVPPGARLCLSPPPPAAVSSMQDDIYKVPRNVASVEPDLEEVYDHPHPLRDPLKAPHSPSEVYDTPTSFGKKVARVAPQPVPTSCPEPEQIPEDIYDVPPAFQKMAEEALEEEDDEDVYSAPSNLKRASALLNLYEVPEEVLCAEADGLVYDVPALALEEPCSPPTALHRLSISSAGSSRSKSSVESGSGKDAPPVVKELVVDVVSALETLARLHQCLQGLLAGFAGTHPPEMPDTEPLREALKDFIGFAQVAVMGSTQASDPTLHQRLARHLELLEEALRSLPRGGVGVPESSGGRRAKSIKTPVKGGETSSLLPSLLCQISESSASVAGLVQANANLLFQRPRLPSNESLSRRPLPALPTQLSAERLVTESASPAFIRKGSIQDRPLPPPPPVFISGKAELGPNEYEGIKLTEEYDYVHLKEAEKPNSHKGSGLPGVRAPHQNGQPFIDPESPSDTLEELSPGTSPELDAVIHEQLSKNNPGERSPDPSHEDLQLLHFYAGQCQGHYTTLLTAIDSFFASVRGNQPPKVFISHGKFVIVTAHKLVFIGDTLARLLASQELRAQVTTSSNALCQALKVVVLATKGAALQYPSLPAVQEMVDRVTELSGCSLAFTTLLSRLAV
ncbi:embryonal Fyn-associated substrate [Lissotriton helveticus]